MTPRELVYATLENRNTTGKVPRELWHLPFAEMKYPGKIAQVLKKFPSDIACVPVNLSNPPATQGDRWTTGIFIDEWGCKLTSVHAGIIGEAKEPLVKEEMWEDIDNIHTPEGLLSFDIEDVNEFCHNTDKFVMMGDVVNPFERLQYIRTTELLYCDLIICPEKVQQALDKIHDFNCRLLEKWAKTDVDAIRFMDDWGSQKSLLINPDLWRKMFKPLYKDYCDIAKKYNKKLFAHSDGNILQIIPDFIETGVDAINSQVFLMGLDNVAKYKGQITFWGEMDRQHILSSYTPEQTKDAARQEKNMLWQNGGFIAQLEFGPGALPENVMAAYEAWDEE